MEQFNSGFTAYMTKAEKRMWFVVGAATLIILVLLLWGIAHKPVKLKSFPETETVQ